MSDDLLIFWVIAGISGVGAALAIGYLIYRQTTVVTRARASALAQEKVVESLREELKERDLTIAGLQHDSAKQDELLLKLRQQVSQADSTANALQQQTKEQKITIDNLRHQLQTIEQESIQSKALFSTISNVAYDYVFVLDEQSTIIALNKSAAQLFEDGNPIGARLPDVIDAPDLEDIVLRATSEEESLEEQFMMGGRYYRARTQIMRYASDDHFIGIAMQDITQLVRLNRARRDMVANISHELRTPITKIRFTIDSLFHDQHRPKRKASIASLREISQEVGELEDVVQELLDLSMIESGQAIMRLVEEPLVEIVDAAIDRLEEKLEQRELRVVRHIPEKMHVLCDREHIRRVMTNLISNAIKWSPPDDSITISVANAGEEVIVSVFDNGPGVPDDQRERIFERFYQVDTARSGKDGSGLGLAICKHIVEAHGGRIWAEGNSQGAGGRFLFTLLNAMPEVESVEMDRAQHDPLPAPTRDTPVPDAEIASEQPEIEDENSPA